MQPLMQAAIQLEQQPGIASSIARRIPVRRCSGHGPSHCGGHRQSSGPGREEAERLPEDVGYWDQLKPNILQPMSLFNGPWPARRLRLPI